VRVLTVTSSYPKFPSDTTAPFIESIVGELARRGHRLTVVLPARDDLAPASIEGVRFRPYRYAPSSALQVFGYAESLRADVAVRKAALGVMPLALASGVRALSAEMRSDTYDVVHAHWVVPSGAMASFALSSSGPPLVVSLHGSDVFLSETSRLARFGARAAFRRAAALTACSRDLAARSLALGARNEPEVIPYGVDTDLFHPAADGGASVRKALALPEGARVILALGRLVRKKGFEYLVDAVSELVRRGLPAVLVLAGKGDLEGELLEKASALGVSDRVHLVGNVERGRLPAYFALADVVVVPSVRDAAGNVDGLPNVLLEAMASEKAIVATAVAGIPEAIRPGKEGILVPERDVRELANALAEVLGSAERRQALGRAARKRAEDDFGWKRAGERFESVLRSVAEARRP
jgi:glycosyltransferase involved in cell wall biosynthesis